MNRHIGKRSWGLSLLGKPFLEKRFPQTLSKKLSQRGFLFFCILYPRKSNKKGRTAVPSVKVFSGMFYRKGLSLLSRNDTEQQYGERFSASGMTACSPLRCAAQSSIQISAGMLSLRRFHCADKNRTRPRGQFGRSHKRD